MTAKPVRLQLSRMKGFKLQEFSLGVNGLPAVLCARPGAWGNPYVIGTPGIPDAATAVQLYRDWSDCWDEPNHPTFRYSREALETLRGKNLACWCRLDEPCHCDVLLERANQ
jgi:Domain of unknown function (DUF4326)